MAASQKAITTHQEVERLRTLQTKASQLSGTLQRAQIAYDRTLSELNSARNIVGGYERSRHPADRRRCEEARARLERAA